MKILITGGLGTLGFATAKKFLEEGSEVILLDNKNLDNFTSWGKTGIRAQLIDVKTKKLEMDFKFEGDEKSFHVLNAVSPAFTCAEPFSKLIVKNIKSKLN